MVILQEKYGNEFKVGFLNLGTSPGSPDFKHFWTIPMSARETYNIEVSNDFAMPEEDSEAALAGDPDAVSEHFERAEAVHARAREIIDRYDATSRTAEECSRRTKELLSQGGR
jgi:hypothetical protein